MARFRVVVIVSTDKSDLFFANRLAKESDVVGVLVEDQSAAVNQGQSMAQKIRKTIFRPREFISGVVRFSSRHWWRRLVVYNRPENLVNFGEEGEDLFAPEGCRVYRTKPGQLLDDPAVKKWLEDLSPDLFAVCGSSLLSSKVLAIPKSGALNLHGGLSQYYRGLFTTDWAVHNGEPEYVGATVHFISNGIDDGKIVYQGRPSISASDNPNSLYEKVVRLGVTMMVRAIEDVKNGVVRPSALPHKGALYTEKMMTGAIRRRTWKRLKSGMMQNYIDNRRLRDEPVVQSLVNEFDG